MMFYYIADELCFQLQGKFENKSIKRMKEGRKKENLYSIARKCRKKWNVKRYQNNNIFTYENQNITIVASEALSDLRNYERSAFFNAGMKARSWIFFTVSKFLIWVTDTEIFFLSVLKKMCIKRSRSCNKTKR